ncbi:MAG: endonuclease/exonuclease/phosphatase family protein [Oligoflexia bacterium]|nr:endonuclease/exonuclease/phosphatase family protein [Oligoflexia bacterium]
MKMRLLFIVFFFITHSVSANTISVQTLNIYSPFYVGNKEDRKNSLFQFLKNESSDINFFQEVWFESDYQQLEKISQSIGLSSIYHTASFKYKKQSGLMTAVKGNVYKTEFYFFPQGNSWIDSVYNFFNINKGFGVTYATLPQTSNTPFIAVNVHLHHLSQETRLLQLLSYLKWFLNESILSRPVIFAGDFNFEPSSLEFEMIQHIFRFKEPQSHLNFPYKCTVCKENEYFIGHTISKILQISYERTIDYIFFRSSPSTHLTPKNFVVFPKKYNGNFLSDHYGVKAEIKFEPYSKRQEISWSELENRIKLFLETLDKVQYQLSKNSSPLDDIPLSEYYRKTTAQINVEQFLNSLRNRLRNEDSLLIQHLSQN